MKTHGEIEKKADFSYVRYGQLWEDADVLLKGLDIQSNDTCLSICSAGDNALAMVAENPTRVIALDVNPVQIYCLELRVIAYQRLEYQALLELFGSRDSNNRWAHYQQCRDGLNNEARAFWDAQESLVTQYGIGGSGKFERYFRLFKDRVLPWVHNRATVAEMLKPKPLAQRQDFYHQRWNNWRWRLLLKLFFSKTMMGRLGRDPAFFAYVEGSFSDHVGKHVEKASSIQDPSKNSYLHWILTGAHGEELPYALREENVEKIRQNLDTLEWHLLSTDDYAKRCRADGVKINKHNLSDIFEYMSEENYHASLANVVDMTATNGRLLYWNMMVPRARPESMSEQLRPLTDLANELHAEDKAFFYDQLHIEECL